MIPAIVYICLMLGNCESHEIQIEKKACGLTFHAMVPINGEWKEGYIRVKCKR